MYAVIKSGGKQYKVQAGDILQVEKLEGDKGAVIQFTDVLLATNSDSSQVLLGKPTLSGAVVDGEIVGQGRGDKITIVKMKRRKQYRRTQGHRQNYTQVLITGIATGTGEKSTLAADQKATKLKSFGTQLKPKGLAHTPKTLGSRKRAASAAKAKAAKAS
jgi:large subunit ribosomal protein L21